MCDNEHSINHVNNFHYCDDDTVQDEMLLKSSRKKKYSQNIGQKDVLPINYKYPLHLKLGETTRNYYLYWEGC